MENFLKKTSSNFSINLIVTLIFLLIAGTPIIYVAIAMGFKFDDMFKIYENMLYLIQNAFFMQIIYICLLLIFAIFCFAKKKTRTIWTVWLGIVSILLAAWNIYSTLILH